MKDNDYNILKALFELPTNIKLFISKERDEIFNISLPMKKELVQRINKLISSGLIYCKDINTNILYDCNYKILEQDTNTILGLTSLGGGVIEKKLGIDWNQYIYEEVGFLNMKYEIFIYSGSLEKIKSILKFFPNNSQDIKILSPWFPVYWKKLPTGYTISFITTEKYYIKNIQNNEEYRNFVYYNFPKS